jgi:hypothetical protein
VCFNWAEGVNKLTKTEKEKKKQTAKETKQDKKK